MDLTLEMDLPSDFATRFPGGSPDLANYVREAAAVQMYRMEKLSHMELRKMLGLDRWETEALLKRYGVFEDLPTLEEIREDVDSLREFLRNKP